VVGYRGIAIVVALSVTSIGCGDGSANRAAGSVDPVHDDVLTVATQLPARGFWNGSTPAGIRGGLEAALADDLADRLDLDRVRVVEVAFDELVAGEAEGYDIGLAQVSVTGERRQDVDFSRPYLSTFVGVVGRPGAEVPDLAAARELRWGVARSTTEQDLVADHVRPDREARAYPDTTATLAAVAGGQVDVAAVDLLRALAEVSANADLSLIAQIAAPQLYAGVLPKGSPNLEAVDAAIRALGADGTLRRLSDELFDTFHVSTDDLPTIRLESS
jgi:polar amino acid transport system substrate-binding protein